MVNNDLLFWLNDKISFNGEIKEEYKFGIDYSSRVTIMSYRDMNQEILKISEGKKYMLKRLV